LNVYLHPTVKVFNSIYCDFGVNVPNFPELDVENPPTENFVYILPPHLMRSLGLGLKLKYDMKHAFLSGWAMHNPYNAEPFLVSDHADFYDLLKFVDMVSPKKIYTVHGFASEFAAALKNRGYDAQPL